MLSKTQQLLMGAFAVAIFAHFWHLSAACLDGDEIFSLLTSRGSLPQITSAALADSVHPPLFYYVLHYWRLAGEGLGWLRLLPVVFGTLALWPLYLLASQLGLKPLERAALIAVAGVHPSLIFYSQHLRMYSLFFCLALFSMWLLERSRFVALTFVNVAMVYTHYFGVMVVALQVFCVLLRSRPWRKVLASASVTALAFSPWLLAASRAAAAKGGLAGNLNWVPRPGLSEFFWFFIDLAGCAETYWAGAYLAPVIFGLLAVALWKLEQRREMLMFAGVFAALPALLTFVASRTLSLSVWGHRHMLFAAAPFLLLGVASVCRLKAKWTLPILTIWAAQLCLPMVHDDKKLAWDRLAVATMREERSQADVPFFAVDPYADYTFRYYLDQRFVVTKATPQDLHGKHFWVAYNEGSESLEATLRGRGCSVGATFRESDRYHSVRVFPVQCE